MRERPTQRVDGRRVIVTRVLQLSAPARYGTTVAVTGLAVALRFLLNPMWHLNLPFITFYPAVMIAGWFGGFGPGMVAVLLSTAATGYFWMAPTPGPAWRSTGDLIALTIFAGTGALISALNGAWRRTAGALAHAEERQHQATLEAEQANRIKDEFMAVLSHELRTPLNATLGWAHLLASGRLDPDRARQAAETIERNAQTEAKLVESMLDLSRIVTGTLTLDRKRVDLSSVVRAAVEALRPMMADVRLRVETPQVPVIVDGDASRLQQVVWNLLSNAIKFTAADGQIDVRLMCADSLAQIRVSDTGQGINPDFLPHVFERFKHDGHRTGVRPGLGLGLALVREFAEAHGGTVSAASPGEGRGSTFVVSLPTAPALPS